VKYRLSPTGSGPSRAPDGDPHRLRSDLKERLSEGPAGFTFEIQRPEAGAHLEIEKATVRWAETDAPFTPIRHSDTQPPGYLD
jgi:hypothetical protein